MDHEKARPGKVLVTGANGQLGSELRRLLPAGETVFTDLHADATPGRETRALDITDSRAVRALFLEVPLSACINAAAYTAVDKAESEPDLALAINATGPQWLAAACQESGARLIHISTDFVFGGNAAASAEGRPYRPEDPVSPMSSYGRTKAEGEQRVLAGCERAAVLRTSWLYSTFGANFVKTMLRLGAERDELGVVADQFGTPTYARDLAKALLPLLQEPLRPADYGIYHYTNGGRTTWAGFAEAIMAGAGLACRIKPITTAEYPTPAARPAWSVLDSTRFHQRFGTAPIPWERSLTDCLTSLRQDQ